MNESPYELTKCFLFSLVIRTSFGEKLSNNLAVYSISPSAIKNSPVEISSKDKPTVPAKCKDARKLFDLGFTTPSTVARPGVIISVTPLFTIFFVFFGSSN